MPPSERERAIAALVSGVLLGLVMALLSRGKGPSPDPR